MRRLKKGGILVMLAVLMGTATISCSYSNGIMSNGMIDTGNLHFVEADLTEKPFVKIEVETVADVYYVQNNGDQQSVRFDFTHIKDDKLRKQFEDKTVAIYREGKLKIGLKSKITGVSKLDSGSRMRVYITSPDLVKITLEGIGSFHSDAINSDVFDIDNEGVGNIEIQNLLANRVGIDNEGVGSVTVVRLQSDDVNIDNEGVGNVKIGHFKGGRLKIDNEGVGKVEAQVDCESIHAMIEGVGNIKLSGVTNSLTKEKDGVGRYQISDLKIRNN